MDLIEKATKKGILYEVVPNRTYFIAVYDGDVVYGGGLDNTGWDKLNDSIIQLKYVLSNGDVITLPKYKKYLHLVEASMSIDDSGGLYNKNYHYVYIKGYTGDKVITHKIHLRAFDKEDIGKVDIYTDDLNELNGYGSSWKRGK